MQDNQGFVAPVVSWLRHIKFIWKWDTFRMTVFRLSRVNVLHGQKFTCNSNTNYSADLFSFSFNRQRFRTRKSKCGSIFINIGKRRLIKINNKLFWDFFSIIDLIWNVNFFKQVWSKRDFWCGDYSPDQHCLNPQFFVYLLIFVSCWYVHSKRLIRINYLDCTKVI